jgi:hypothetical protein
VSAVTGSPAVSATCHRRSDDIPLRVLRIALQISLNLIVKKVKRCGHGFRSFDNYRLRVLLHAGGVRWPESAVVPPLRTRSPHSDA